MTISRPCSGRFTPTWRIIAGSSIRASRRSSVSATAARPPHFAPPFGVELATWLHTLGLGFVDAARATFSLCLISSALGMYAFAQRVLGGRWPAVLAALGFLWAPYVLL